jgi:hypothetical protein
MTPFSGARFGRRWLGYILRRIHLDEIPGLSVSRFQVGIALAGAWLALAITRKLDKRVHHKRKTETHENRKKPHSLLIPSAEPATSLASTAGGGRNQ